MKKKEKQENYLDKIPLIKNGLKWSCDESKSVTVEVENKKIADKIAQKLLKKPKISYIHLDETGSFIWQFIDGKNDISAIGNEVKTHFGKAAEPLYERLIQYFVSLETCGFIEWKTDIEHAD